MRTYRPKIKVEWNIHYAIFCHRFIQKVFRKSQNWSTYGGTITCYFQYTDKQQHKFAFTAAWNRWENYPGDSRYGYVDGNYKIGEYSYNGNNYVCWCAPKRRSFGTFYVSSQRVTERGISNIGSDIGPVNGKTYTQ